MAGIKENQKKGVRNEMTYHVEFNFSVITKEEEIHLGNPKFCHQILKRKLSVIQ